MYENFFSKFEFNTRIIYLFYYIKYLFNVYLNM